MAQKQPVNKQPAQNQPAQKQPQDRYAQRAKQLASAVQRIRGWVGSDPSRSGELGDALVELTTHRLRGHAYPDAAGDAQESVVLAGKLLAEHGPIGPYTPTADAVRYFTAAVQLAALQLGVGADGGAARTMTSLLEWQEQLRKHVDIVGSLAPETAVRALIVQARSALGNSEVAAANGFADAALDRLVEGAPASDDSYLAIDVHRLVADARWAAGRVDDALVHDELARESYDRIVDGRLATPGRLSPALLARLAEPLFGLHRATADRLSGAGEGDRGLLVRRSLVESLGGLTKRLGETAVAQLALSLDDLAADLRVVGREDEARLTAEDAQTAAARVSDHALIAEFGRSAERTARRPGRDEPLSGWPPLDPARALAASTAESSHRPAADAEAELVRQATERAAAERAEAQRLEAERRAAAQAEVGRREAERADNERLAAEQAHREQAEMERLAREQAEADRLEAERRATDEEAERAETKRRREERLADHRLEEERREAERLAVEQVTAEPEVSREEAERLELARLAVELEELERAEQAEREAVEQEAEAERLAAERAEAERLERAEREATRELAERAEAERAEAERAEAERAEAERSEAERAGQPNAAEAERAEAERAEAERAEAERSEAERLERERAEVERLAAEQAEADRQERDRVETERLERERAEVEQVAANQAEAERPTAAPDEPTAPAGPTAPPEPEPAAPAAPDELDLAVADWQAAKAAGERRRARAANERVVELLRPRAEADLPTYGPQLIDALEQLSSIRLRTGDIFGARAPSREAKALAKSLGQ